MPLAPKDLPPSLVKHFTEIIRGRFDELHQHKLIMGTSQVFSPSECASTAVSAVLPQLETLVLVLRHLNEGYEPVVSASDSTWWWMCEDEDTPDEEMTQAERWMWQDCVGLARSGRMSS